MINVIEIFGIIIFLSSMTYFFSIFLYFIFILYTKYFIFFKFDDNYELQVLLQTLICH